MKRLRWRCRRGTKELDILFERFLAKGYGALTDSERVTFERLLDCEDDQLQAWLLTDRRPTDGALDALVQRIRNIPR
ncbi:protein of unknown function DUF339 [Alkalilimnicola ehrlichii MLHE-1]|uniref:FAD assembly factor SdhE n=1 Tax=Alkalilimnicola ehrlichii (strain ATCC BAA-1101 / DSM 17681 / MLHE-1) TaxID=187272 RepID=Q0A902_ALKEH|nr:protein of unknown function DUF339 [Alkalilimnicola ehrlichii MLHE-1]